MMFCTTTAPYCELFFRSTVLQNLKKTRVTGLLRMAPNAPRDHPKKYPAFPMPGVEAGIRFGAIFPQKATSTLSSQRVSVERRMAS